MRNVSYPEDKRVHQAVDARPLKLGATAVLHQFGVRAWTRTRKVRPHAHITDTLSRVKHPQTCENDQAVAGLRVAQDTPPQQHVVVGQGVLLVPPEQSPGEMIQLVVWGLTHHFTCAHSIVFLYLWGLSWP